MGTFTRHDQQTPDAKSSSHPWLNRTAPGRQSWERPIPTLRQTPVGGGIGIRQPTGHPDDPHEQEALHVPPRPAQW